MNVVQKALDRFRVLHDVTVILNPKLPEDATPRPYCVGCLPYDQRNVYDRQHRDAVKLLKSYNPSEILTNYPQFMSVTTRFEKISIGRHSDLTLKLHASTPNFSLNSYADC